MLRHGQASFGSASYDKLSQTGKRQAKITAEFLGNIDQTFTAIYLGEMKRQQETLQPIIDTFKNLEKKVPVSNVSDAFNEYDSSILFETLLPIVLKDDPSLEEYKDQIFTSRKAFQILFEKVMVFWISGKFDMEGLPRWLDFKTRLQKALIELMKKHGKQQRILVSTSGGPVSAAVQMALDLSDEKTMDVAWQIQNASLTRFKYNTSGIMLCGFNDLSHLNQKKL